MVLRRGGQLWIQRCPRVTHSLSGQRVALNVTHGKRASAASRVIVYPLVYMTLCIAVWLLSWKELPLIIALTYRTLHAPNVSFKLVSSCDPPLVPFGSGWINAHYWKWDIKVTAITSAPASHTNVWHILNHLCSQLSVYKIYFITIVENNKK